MLFVLHLKVAGSTLCHKTLCLNITHTTFSFSLVSSQLYKEQPGDAFVGGFLMSVKWSSQAIVDHLLHPINN